MQRRRPLLRRRVEVDREQRAVGVDAEQERLARGRACASVGRRTMRAGRRPSRSPRRRRAPPARPDGCAARRPTRVAPPLVAGAVEAAPGERVLPGSRERRHDLGGDQLECPWSPCRRCWNITRSTPAASYARSRSITSPGVPASQLVRRSSTDTGSRFHSASRSARARRSASSAPTRNPCISEKRSVAGSRPAASRHAAASRSRAARASSGRHVDDVVLGRVAGRQRGAALLAAPPISIGSGRWTGLGSASRSSTV